ncbi:hypothetical protein [Alicyclobacillus fodiniaquatilis]|uniref:TrbC/VIRB2 family protein n=1 Tax=Alicyclobacillus fodiniaquatilis TaxID=1661150 RepID=A0ABW4JGK9_9BACL
MKLRKYVKGVGTTLSAGAIALAVNTQLALASTTAASNTTMTGGYSSVVGGTTASSDVVTEITNFTSTGMKILAAIAAAYTLFHLVKAGLALMSGSGMRKEEGMQQLKMTVIGGVVALGAYFFAGVIGAIASAL